MAYDILKRTTVPGTWSIGASIFTTTEDVDVKLSALLTDTNNLNVDITRRWGPGVKRDRNAVAFINAWIRWRDETYKFINEWKGFKMKLAWNYYDNAVEKLRELAKWREKFERLSGRETTGPSSHAPEREDDKGNIWKWAAIALAGGAGTLYFLKKTGG